MENSPKIFSPAGKTGSKPGFFSDLAFLGRAMELGWRAAGQTDPNPLVGALVVSAGEIVGEGYHQRCGAAHAEVVALDQAGELAAGATLYVSLEPCAHQGRTPPCVDRIIRAGISRVVVPLIDPDSRVVGGGAETLRARGVKVEFRGKEAEALMLNLGYYKHHLGLGPTVTLKMAATIDGKIASARGRRDDVTGTPSRFYVHQMRACNDCVVVGIDTVLADDPVLDCRLLDSGTPPVPVVIDSSLRFPAGYRWVSEGREFYVVTGRGADPGKIRNIEGGGGRVLECGLKNGRLRIEGVLDALSREGFKKILVEGGSKVFSSFIRSGHWDALYLFQAPKVFGENGVPLFDGDAGQTLDAENVGASLVGDDVLFRCLNKTTYRKIMSYLDTRMRRVD